MAKALSNLTKRRKSSLSFLAKPKLLHFGTVIVHFKFGIRRIVFEVFSFYSFLISGRHNFLQRENSKKSKEKPQKPPKMGKTSRVVVCGMAGVGKTAILEQLIYGNITPSTVSIFCFTQRKNVLIL